MINSAFITSYGHGRRDMMSCLLKDGADIHYLHDFCLWDSVTKKDADMTTFLLEHGADIHMCHEQPLRTAIGHGDFAMVKLLIEKGADWRGEKLSLREKAIKHEQDDILAFLDTLYNTEGTSSSSSSSPYLSRSTSGTTSSFSQQDN
jgi:ankyrin repeat protein